MRVPVIQTSRDSFLRRRDPRVKVALFVLLIVFIYVAPSWAWMACMVFIGLVLAVLAKAPVRWLAVLLALQIPNMLGLIAIPAIGQFWSGEFAFDPQLQFGVKLALAWVSAILIGVSLISSMEINELVEGMRGLGVPRSIAFAVGYVFILAYLSFHDIIRIIEAMRLKGVELSFWRPVRMVIDLARLTPPMIFTVVRRGADMAAALSSRGFALEEKKSARLPLKFDFADAAALACGLLIVGYSGAVTADVAPPPHPMLAAAEAPEEG